MGRYVVREAEEYFDWDDCDSHGNPKKKIRYTGVEYETTVEPEDSHDVHMLGNDWEEHTVIK